MTYFQFLFQDNSRGTEKHHSLYQSQYPNKKPQFELGSKEQKTKVQNILQARLRICY